MARVIADAQARWDTDSDPSNPGWVVDVTFLDGTEDTYAAAPEVYHAPKTARPSKIVAETLRWEGLRVAPIRPIRQRITGAVPAHNGHRLTWLEVLACGHTGQRRATRQAVEQAITEHRQRVCLRCTHGR